MKASSLFISLASIAVSGAVIAWAADAKQPDNAPVAGTGDVGIHANDPIAVPNPDNTAISVANPPTDWIDPDTGHRIIRLSRDPGTGSLYFNQNGYTPDGQRLIMTTDHGLQTVDLLTHQIQQATTSKVTVLFMGRKTGQAYYAQNRTIYAVDLKTNISRKVVELPFKGSVQTINSDETLLAGSVTKTAGTGDWPTLPPPTPNAEPALPAINPDGSALTAAQKKDVMLDHRLAQHTPMALFTINTTTGELKLFNYSTDWLNHVQFSPTDPEQLLFCHEGPWQKVDRIWTIRTDGTQLTCIHQRTMNMEIAGHEWWSTDGKTVWYDLQTPRGVDFWVAGYNIDTHQRIWYHLEPNQWGVHFNSSSDNSLFASDGGDPTLTARAPDGAWIWLLKPHVVADLPGMKPAPNASGLVRAGYFEPERLVNMKDHQYHLEPNVNFTPDGKWIVFRTNMFGKEQVLEVEVARSAEPKHPWVNTGG